MVTCSLCGATSPDGNQPPLTWTSSVERGQQRWYCERCSRDNLRSIESKLDSDWW